MGNIKDLTKTWKKLTDTVLDTVLDKVLDSSETARYIKFVVIQLNVLEDQTHQYHIYGNQKSDLFLAFGKVFLLSNQFLWNAENKEQCFVFFF